MEASLKAGRFSWNELLTDDVPAATGFYTQLFGWTAEPMSGTAGDYTVFKDGEEQVAGLMQLPPGAEQMGARPYWGAYVTVQDLEATTARARQLGAVVLVESMEVSGMGRFSTIQDPQGAIISFFEYTRGG